MNTTAKPTLGEWKAQFHHRVNDEVFMYWINAKTSVATSNPGDIDLCAEAGTVYHETGLTPRQLADLCAELMALLRRVQHVGLDEGGPCSRQEKRAGVLSTDIGNALARAKAVPK